MVGTLNAKIPFQPGLELGSIVKGETIEKMNAYGEALEKIEKVQKEVFSVEQEIKLVQGKIAGISKKEGKLETLLKNVYQAQEKALKNRLERLPGQLEKIGNLELPTFTNISTGLESPLDFDKTELAFDARGFNSVRYSSQYFDMNQSMEKIKDQMKQTSSSTSASVKGSYWLFKAKASGSYSKAAMDRVAEIKNQGHASKVLLVNSLVTSSTVRYFKNRTYDSAKLKTILDTMGAYGKETVSKKDKKELKKRGISVIKVGENQFEKRIYLLTEAIMGGSFSGILTYLKEDEATRKKQDNATHSGVQGGVSGGAKFSFIGGKGSVSHASQRAKESHNDEVDNEGKLNMTIEFIAQGAIPQLSRNTVVRDVLKFHNQNLKEYHSSGGEKSKDSVETRQAELQEAMYKALNVDQKTKTEKEMISVHTAETVYKAYDDFCSEIKGDHKSGVPIGFNYSILSEKRIRELLGEAKPKDKEKEKDPETTSISNDQ